MNEACFENSKEKHKRHALMMTGRKDSEYTKKKKSKKARKKTVVIDIVENKNYLFNSREEAREFIGTTIRTLNNHLDKNTFINNRYGVKSIDP